MQPSKIFDILLVDDNAADVRMVTEGLKDVLPATRLSVAGDGIQAIRFLRQEGEYASAPQPNLILMDLRLPRKGGFDALREIKQDPRFIHIPVVVQSSSEAVEDINRAYLLHANSYITKPSGLDECSRIMRSLVDFWITVAKLPEGK